MHVNTYIKPSAAQEENCNTRNMDGNSSKVLEHSNRSPKSQEEKNSKVTPTVVAEIFKLESSNQRSKEPETNQDSKTESCTIPIEEQTLKELPRETLNVTISNMSDQSRIRQCNSHVCNIEPRSIPKEEQTLRVFPREVLNVTDVNNELNQSRSHLNTCQPRDIQPTLILREEQISRVLPREILNITNVNNESSRSKTNQDNQVTIQDQAKELVFRIFPTSEESLIRTNTPSQLPEVAAFPNKENLHVINTNSKMNDPGKMQSDNTIPAERVNTQISKPTLNPENETLNVINATTPAERVNTQISKPTLNPENETLNVINATTPAERVNTQISKPTLNPENENLNVINATRLNVNELTVRKLSIGEIESSRLVTSNVESSSMQVSHIQSETGNLTINSIEFPTRYSAQLIQNESEEPIGELENKDPSPSLEDGFSQSARSRISSMIPEIGSDDESNDTVIKVTRPARRKRPSKGENVPAATPSSSNASPASLAELMGQILQICHSSVGQAIHSLLEQFIPEDREKRNEVQAAIWIVTIIVAGCLMLGLQTNEKVVHHHHWDFHFPPPH